MAFAIMSFGMMTQSVYDATVFTYNSYKIQNTPIPLKKGWQLGDDINTLTRQGNYPSWTTARTRYYKNEAFYYPEKYSSSNLFRMQQGKAPLVLFDKNGLYYPLELHHKNGRNIPDPHNINSLLPLPPWDHNIVDPYRKWHH